MTIESIMSMHSSPARSAMKHSMSTSAILDMGNLDWRHSVKKPLTYKLGNSTIRFQKPLVAALSVVLVALLLLLYVAAAGKKSHSGDGHYEDHFHYVPQQPVKRESGSCYLC